MNVLFMVMVACAAWWVVSLAVAMIVGAAAARREQQTGLADGDEARLGYPPGGERSAAVDPHRLVDRGRPPTRRLAVVRERAASTETTARRTTAA